MRADWTDPSNPVTDPASQPYTDPAQIAQGFTDFYKPLFASKPSEPEASEICLAALRDGPQVQPPTAEACGLP